MSAPINMADYPIRADSIFAGRSYPNGIRVDAIYRKNRSTASASDYVALLSLHGVVRVVPYSAVQSAAVLPQTQSLLYKAFCNAFAQQTGAAAVQSAVKAPTIAIENIDVETALAVMTQLVRAGRKDPQIAKVVKNLAELI